MNTKVIIRQFNEPPICENEILRYAKCDIANEEITKLLHSCIEEARNELTYKVCFSELPIEINDDKCDFGFFSVKSKSLANNLCGCEKVILFCATVGLSLDRLITKYSKLSPARALILQAFGTERIEALCDAFCTEISLAKNMKSRPRFSPGYGDISLDIQKDILSFLETNRNIAVFLNESMLMTPSKSVTAFMGLYK